MGFYENDTLVRIMYEDFIKGTMDSDWEASDVTADPKRDAFYEVNIHIPNVGILSLKWTWPKFKFD